MPYSSLCALRFPYAFPLRLQYSISAYTTYLRLFIWPPSPNSSSNPYQRYFEALRTTYVEGLSTEEAARGFG